VHVAILGKDDRFVMRDEFDVESFDDFIEVSSAALTRQPRTDCA
jgi:hypothetical protein